MLEMILINGLVFGGQFAILAVGFSLVFGVAKILNMAHTAFYMIAAILLYLGTRKLGLSALTAAILAPLIAGMMGMVCYKLFFDRIKEHQTAVMIIAIALAMLFQEVFLIGLTGEYRGVALFTPGSFEIAGVAVLYQHLYSIGISLVMIVGVWIMLRATKLGKAIRAVAEDREIANLMGINVSQVSLIVMGISTALAGVAGIAVAPIFMVHPLMWVHPMIIVLAVVVLGGLQSIKGSIIAAFILGFAEVLVISLIPKGSFLRGAVSLSVMAVVLMLRPEGLFGIVFEEERL